MNDTQRALASLDAKEHEDDYPDCFGDYTTECELDGCMYCEECESSQHEEE